MKKEQQKENLDAFALFPELMHNLDGSANNKNTSKEQKIPEKLIKKWQPKVKNRHIPPPPPPPDVSWIRTGEMEELGEVEDIPTALVLIEDEDANSAVSSTLRELGYQIEVAEDPRQAMEKLASVTYAAVVMHEGFGGVDSLADSTVHNFITWLPIRLRRLLFFIVVGKFHTLYDIEALCLSVNLVVNDADVDCLRPILKKSFRDYEELFGPLLEVLR